MFIVRRISFFATFLILLFSSGFSFAQEICDNGIDDDGDMLIDLNDDSECFCLDTIGTTTLFNDACGATGIVSVATDYLDGIDYQWYRDGIAQVNEDSWNYFIPYPYDGIYLCYITTVNGCYSTTPVTVIVNDNEYNITDTLCTGDSYVFGNFNLTSGGNYFDYLTDQYGCDSIVNLNLFERNCGDTIMVNEKFKKHLIRVGVDVNGDGKIQFAEALAVDSLKLSNPDSLSSSIYQIGGTQGLEHFVNLKYLDLSYHRVPGIHLDSLKKLEHLNLYRNPVSYTIDLSPVSELKYLNIGSTQIDTLNLSVTPKLESFINQSCRIKNMDLRGLPLLKELDLRSIINLDTILDLSGNPQLKKFSINSNWLKELDLSFATELEYLYISQTTKLKTQLDLSNNKKIKTLILVNRQMENIDLSLFPLLEYLDLTNNSLTELHIDICPLLYHCNVSLNSLTEFLVSNNPLLQKLVISNNRMESEIDFSKSHNLEYFESWPSSMIFSRLPFDFNNCYNLDTVILWRGTQLLIKNGSNESFIDVLSDGRGYDYICVDEEQLDEVKNQMDPNVNLGTYCYFTPPGDSFEVNGIVKYTIGNDCENFGNPIPMVKLFIQDENNEGFRYLDQENGYSLLVPSGDVMIVPEVQNEAYFSISPDTLRLNFPLEESPFEQDFCLTAKSDVTDISIHLIPVGDAQAGFRASYRLQVNNNGTITNSGEIDLFYDESFMTFEGSSVLATSIENGKISWEYNNLLPFQLRRVKVDFRLNRPTDTPSLNGGDILNLKLESIENNDINSYDNVAILQQTVVNSFDPNDKICLEGEHIELISIGSYLHYRIRFENTGDAHAAQVVIRDSIDASKFQIETLVPLDGSHDFHTRIKDHVVEFIFEDIDLSFEEGKNMGYVIFKIKTREDLEDGDLLINDAEIFFDFNFPIVTEEYVTNVLDEPTLSIDGFSFSANLNTQNHVELNWSSYDSSDEEYYLVEQSCNGIDFEQIAKVDVDQEEINNKYWQHIDVRPCNGENYYRIKYKNKNGNLNFSKIISINVNRKIGIDISPNPIILGQRLYVNIGLESEVELKIYDIKGSLVKKDKFVQETVLSIEGLETGIYQMVFTGPYYLERTSLVIIN